MKMFEERRPRPIALISMTVIAVLLALGLSAGSLPFLSPSNGYAAYFVNSAGLLPGDSVRIAGVPVGEIRDVVVEGDRVRVDFDVDEDQHVGDRARAGIRLQTFLGTKFLDVDPIGEDELSQPIPVERTTVPYDLPEALSGLGETVTAIDTGTLAESLDQISATLAAVEPAAAPLLDDLARISETVSSRDDQLDSLLEATRTVSATLADRDTQVVDVMGEASLFFDALIRRRDTIRALLRDVRLASQQVTGLIEENRGQLGPLLERLETTATLLEANLPALDSALTQLAPSARYLANATGDGRWLDLYLDNLDEIIGGGIALPQEEQQ